MCIVQHVEKKSVFVFQPMKRLLSTTLESAKPAATFSIFFLKTEKQQIRRLEVMIHNVLQERRVSTTKMKNHLHF